MTRYPLFLDLRDRKVLVCGGGPVAARRTAGVWQAGARVVVVAPDVCEELRDLIERSRLQWVRRKYLPGDTAGAWLVHTATGDKGVDEAVAAEAEANRIWCIRADEAGASTAWTAATSHGSDGVTVAVSGGGDPHRAVRLRDAIDLALATGTLPTRRSRPGAQVSLVGGGPGDPELITVRGRRLIAAADVVVVDRLAPRGLLDGLAADVLVIDVGKAPGRQLMTQEEINKLIVEHASAGSHVVRLKGGDPFVLGRGGEEALACIAAGVPVEVVPGVTSAISVPAAAGIPVTHRGLATGFLVVSAHDELDRLRAQVRGAGPGITLVLLMGVGRLRTLAAALIEDGRDPGTPAAVIESGWTPEQRTTAGTLATLPDLAEERGVAAPAVVVVGDVVGIGAVIGEQRIFAGG